MARSDLLVRLVQFGMQGDRQAFRKVVEAVIAEERNKQHRVLAEQLEGLLQSTPADRGVLNGTPAPGPKLGQLFQEIVPKRQLSELILPKEVISICRDLIQEQHRSDLLRSYGMEPRNRILVVGPPGNGKTSLAEAIAEALMVPMIVIRYEGVVGAYLGETAIRIRQLFEYAATRKCVLFFDEFETLGKERGDTHETGEIKRVVSSLLLQIDSLPSHVVVIGATNHPELLDRAVWRRFQVRLNLPQPTRAGLTEWFERFQRRVDAPLGMAPLTLAKKLLGHNYAEVEEFGMALFRQFILEQPEAHMSDIVDRTLKQWSKRSINMTPEGEGADNA